MQREKKKFETQRLTLKRCCVRHAAASSGVIYSSSVEHDHAEEEGLHMRDMEEELQRLQAENELLQEDLDHAVEEIELLEAEKDEAEKSRDQMSDSWRFNAGQLEQAWHSRLYHLLLLHLH